MTNKSNHCKLGIRTIKGSSNTRSLEKTSIYIFIIMQKKCSTHLTFKVPCVLILKKALKSLMEKFYTAWCARQTVSSANAKQ